MKNIFLTAVFAVLTLMSLSAPVRGAEMKEQIVETNKITIDNFCFSPMAVSVKPGTKVTWINKDDVPHTVTGKGKDAKFKSRAMDTDQSFSFTFEKAGTYEYFCSVHPKMTGKIIVK